MTEWLNILAQDEGYDGELFYIIAILFIGAISAIAEKFKRSREKAAQQDSSPEDGQGRKDSRPKPPTLEPPQSPRPPVRSARPVPPPMRRPPHRPPPVATPRPSALPQPSVPPFVEEEVVVWTPLAFEKAPPPQPEPQVSPRPRVQHKPSPKSATATKPVAVPKRGPVSVGSFRGLSKRDIRRAVVLHEILGQPLALRKDEQYPTD